MKKMLICFALAALSAGCSQAARHYADVTDNTADRVSAGVVQKEIRVGMSGAEVIEVLGSPNMVTTDNQRRENWVYDKISTVSVYSTSTAGVDGGLAGIRTDGAANGFAAGALGFLVGISNDSGATSTTQRTLTVIVKFDKNNKVRDFAYRQSSF